MRLIMADQPYILALDIGTSSTRALLYDSSGNPVPGIRSQLTYQVTTSHKGEVSVDAEMLLALVVRTIDTVLQQAGERAEQIAAVATSAFWHTLVPLSADGQPLMPLLTWEDTRPQEAATELRSLLDESAIHRRTGARLQTSYWPAKIRWLSQAYPHIARQTARYASFAEYLYERFLGRAICSISMASGTGLFALHTRNWDTELLDFLHLTPENFSPLGDRTDPLEGLAPAFATRWPALNHIPWLPAIGDGAAANIGSNCSNIDIWAVTIGTSSAMRVVVPPDQITPEQGLWLYAVDGRRALLGGALSEGGNVMAWLRQILQTPDLAELDKQLAQLAPAAHGLTILPQLAGERSPGWHTQASMTISGLGLHTTQVEIIRAALEAVIFQLSRVYDQLRQVLATHVTRLRLIASGGALLKSPLLSQILADTLNVSLELSDGGEASARGVALLALETLGILPDLAQLPFKATTIVQPDPQRHAIYEEARARQQVLYNLLLD
jgi:gluconokinase